MIFPFLTLQAEAATSTTFIHSTLASTSATDCLERLVSQTPIMCPLQC